MNADLRAVDPRVTRFFDLLHEMDVAAWGRLWHDDGEILVPYPPDGFPPHIGGQATIVDGFHGLIGVFASFDVELTAVFPAADPMVTTVEYRVRAELARGGEYTNDNLAIFEFDDDLVRRYHDYFDPRRFQLVVDALADA
jgi:uncharacterized protein